MSALYRSLARALRRPLGAVVARRLGGYRQRYNAVDARLPLLAEGAPSVAVVGAGLAGIGAAATLAERGYAVTLLEASRRIGGKVGGEEIAFDGRPYALDHGFHAFFRHYYNLDAFLHRVGARASFVPIEDYTIVDDERRPWRFGDVATTPGLNLLDLAGKELYRFADVLRDRTRRHMNTFLEYDRRATFAALDRTSFAAWAAEAELPSRLRRVLTIFARAFFAEEDRLSAAEVVKAFHFYYLSHDDGLLYDYPAGPAWTELVDPIERYLLHVGVRIRAGHAVASVEPRGEGLAVDGEPFAHVVLAAPARVAREIALRSPGLRAACPRTTERLAALKNGQRYAVLRIWADRDVVGDFPPFVTVERARLLDAVALYHRIAPADRAWVAERGGGSVLELHSYAVPDDIANDRAVRAALLAELVRFFPEMEGASWLHEELRVRDDFTALHVGMASERPATETEHPALTLAGDWVALPIPAMLMEGAYSSGLFAANAILRRAGLREAPIDTVPLRGLLAPRPEPRGPARHVSWRGFSRSRAASC